MIVDCHNHIWDVPWPNLDPYPEMGEATRFLNLMDANDVAAAVVVAHLDEHDPENNERALQRAVEFPGRFHILANVHLPKPDALDKVRAYLGREGLVGISYYASGDDPPDWLRPGPLFAAIAEAGLALNLNVRPSQHTGLREVARAYPDMPILLCHLGGPMRRGVPNPEWETVLESADAAPNIHMKVSGFAYFTRWQSEYPYADVLPYIERLRDAYTARRLLWGSDYPPTMRYMTYRQSLEVVRTHCHFLSDAEKANLLGDNAARLFALG